MIDKLKFHSTTLNGISVVLLSMCLKQHIIELVKLVTVIFFHRSLFLLVLIDYSVPG